MALTRPKLRTCSVSVALESYQFRAMSALQTVEYFDALERADGDKGGIVEAHLELIATTALDGDSPAFDSVEEGVEFFDFLSVEEVTQIVGEIMACSGLDTATDPKLEGVA